MKLFLYCTYEHSAAGFFMTRLEGEELVPAITPEETPPAMVEDFFSYDRFYLLWRDLVQGKENQSPEGGAFFGLRSLKGHMADGRNATVNLALLADESDGLVLQRTALAILGDYDAFCSRLFGWLSSGGPCSYRLDGGAFLTWVDWTGSASELRPQIARNDPAYQLLPFLCRKEPPRKERNSLRLAVCSGDWAEAAQSLGGIAWRRRPKCALTWDEFCEIFTGRGPLWQMQVGDEQIKE